LAGLSLASWSEARLIVQWRGTQRQVSSAALLAVGADGPDPAAALRSVGWQAWALPGAMGPKLANRARPPLLPLPRAWPHAPALLWPQPPALGQRDRIQNIQGQASAGEALLSHSRAVGECEQAHDPA
jgi:hypothetical protein